MPRYEVLGCPFCKEGAICLRVFGGAWQEKNTGRSSLGKGKSVSKSKIDFIVEADCPKCGEDAEKIEKEFYKSKVFG